MQEKTRRLSEEYVMTRRLPLMFLHNAVFVHVSNRLRHNLQILCDYDTIS